jgi:ABC-type transport system substrate-binding protein
MRRTCRSDPAYDPEAAKKLLADAGYPQGFSVKMNCPNDRYVNDAAICQAVAANLARIGMKIDLEAETKGTYFPKILRRDTSFYMLGWTGQHGGCAQRALPHHVFAGGRRPRPIQPGRLQQPEDR